MDEKLDPAGLVNLRRRLLDEGAEDASTILRSTAEGLLACGFQRVRVWARAPGLFCDGERGGPGVRQTRADERTLPEILRRTAESASAHHLDDGVALPLVGEAGALLVEPPASAPGLRTDLEEVAAVVSLGLRRASSEARWRATDQSYRNLFHRLRSGAARCRAIFEGERCVDFVYLEVNEAFAEHIGLRGVVGKRVSEVIPGIQTSDPETFEITGRVVRSGEPEQLERYVAPLGRWFTIRVYREEGDEVVVVFEDISQQKKAQADHAACEHNLRLFVEHAPAAIALLDRDLRYLAASRRFSADYEIGDQPLVGRSHYDVFPEIPERWREVHRRCLAGAVERSEGEPFARADGGVDWVRWEIRPWRAATGEIGGLVLFSEVLTEQHRILQALSESEARLRALIEQAGVGMVETDPATRRFRIVNEKAAQIWGYEREELVGRTWESITHPDDVGADRAALARLLSGEVQSITREKRYVRRSGEVIWCRVTVTRVTFTDGGTSRLAIIEDITAQKKAQAQLGETEERYRAAQKLEAVGRLAGGVAHDFNNLLSVILSYAELAADGLPEDDLLRADLGEIAAAAHRAAGLTRQLLAFSRRQLLAPERVDLNELVGGVGKMLARLIGEDVALELRLADELPPVTVDRGQVEQVLMNLAVNARDAMPEGGRLTIATAACELDEDAAHALELSAGAHVELAVEDTGSGMDEATRARVFEPFFTTKGPGKGTGLGLSTVHGIVRQSGGAVTVESTLGRGTRFRVLLPARDGPPSAPRAPRSGPVLPTAERACVLVIEDEPALRTVVSRVLGPVHEVLLAADAEDAFRLAEAHGPRVRLILSDVILPVMSGPELVQKLRAKCPNARAMFMSGYTDDALERHQIQDRDLIRKPFDLDTLTERVRSALDGR